MIKPNLFIVGSPKCGSTLLNIELGKNKDVYAPKIKELNYFSKESLKVFNSYYKTFITKNIESYEKMFDFNTNVKYFMDASVSYFTFDDVPKKLFEYNDKSKVIICYRPPLERAISHYKMDLRMRYTDESFESLINDRNSFFYRQYVENSLFYKNSKKFVDLFGIDNVYFYSVAKNDNLSLSKFLNIDVKINNELTVNKSKSSNNIIGAFFLNNRDITIRIKSFFPNRVLNFVKHLIYKEDNFDLDINDFGCNRLNQMVRDDWEMFNSNYINRK